MNFGKALSFISPAAGMMTGQGIGKIMPYLSPGFGMLTGKGPFGGHHGKPDEEEEQPVNPMSLAIGGYGQGGMPSAPQSQPTGMFGSGQRRSFGNALSAALGSYAGYPSPWQMMNRGGY